MDPKVEQFMARIKAKNPAEPEFHQAVHEVAESLIPYIEENPRYKHAKILERMAEPERVIMFRVPWINDKGEVEINRGYRIEMNSAIGPYKGGLRFHPTVTLGVLILNEPAEPNLFFAMALILAGVALSQWGALKRLFWRG